MYGALELRLALKGPYTKASGDLVVSAPEDIKSLDSSREDRIKYFEGHIRELQKSAKQNVEKIEKQREKTEQAQVWACRTSQVVGPTMCSL